MNGDNMPQYNGTLYGWFETGTEGVIWILLKNGEEGYDAFCSIEEGDHITIFNEDDTVLYQGVIQKDEETGWTKYPRNPDPELGQQVALGMWVHWIQAGFKPDDWAGLFFHNPPCSQIKAASYPTM